MTTFVTDIDKLKRIVICIPTKNRISKKESKIIKLKGGPGSGHKGHKGIPGHQGGSLPDNMTSQPEISSEFKKSWAINIAQSDLMRSLCAKVYSREELQTIMQMFPYSNQSKDEFVSEMKQLMTSDEVLPKPTKPKDGWKRGLSSSTMLPEVMWYLREHFRARGSGSQIITPGDFRQYSDGHVDERTLDLLYSNSLRKYFQWERSGGLNQLRLKNNYKFSEDGISTKAQILSKQMKDFGMTPEKLYDALMNIRPLTYT